MFAGLIGIIGMFFILSAFILDEFTKINRETRINNLVNLIGSAMLVYYAFTIKALPFIILNSVWVVASIIKMELFMKKKRR